MPSRKDNIDIVRGMALAAAAAVAKGDAVHTEVTEDFANEQLKVRVRIGKRSAVFAVYNADVERVQGDRVVARKVERLIQETLAKPGGDDRLNVVLANGRPPVPCRAISSGFSGGIGGRSAPLCPPSAGSGHHEPLWLFRRLRHLVAAPTSGLDYARFTSAQYV